VTGAARLALRRVEVSGVSAQVWLIGLDCSAKHVRAARATLPAKELARCDAVVDPLKRTRLLLARAALRKILAGELALAPELVEIDRETDARPALVGVDAPSFSFSHTGSWAAVAVSQFGRIGIDIECRDRRVAPALARRLLTGPDARILEDTPTGELADGFLTHWTAMEACAKVLDGGLAHNLRRLQLRDALAKKPRLRDPRLSEIELLRLDLPAPLIGMLALRS
jgi:4'-phosphopantetheinyl transferase